MKLVFLGPSQHPINKIFFEHRDPFAASYEMISKVSEYIKDLPQEITYVDAHDTYSKKLFDLKTFQISGIPFYYRDFIDLVPIPSKNPLVSTKPKRVRYRVRIIDPNIITLDQYFNERRVGRKDSPVRHSIIKDQYNDVNGEIK